MIKSLSRKIPRAGKIRLGTPKQANRPGQNVGYFRVDSQSLPQALVDQCLGNTQPDKLDVHFIRFFPDAKQSVDAIFDSSYQSWQGSKRFCVGDGEKANRLSPEGIIEVPCICPLLEQKKCKQTAVLKLGLCDLPMVGYWEVRSSSWSSIHQFSKVLDMYYAILGEDLFTTKFQLFKRQETVGERNPWVTHLNVHPSETAKLLQRMSVTNDPTIAPTVDELTLGPIDTDEVDIPF